MGSDVVLLMLIYRCIRVVSRISADQLDCAETPRRIFDRLAMHCKLAVLFNPIYSARCFN